jgi:hypothetical protein
MTKQAKQRPPKKEPTPRFVPWKCSIFCNALCPSQECICFKRGTSEEERVKQLMHLRNQE